MANESMRDNWATGAEGWVRNERLFDAVFSSFTAMDTTFSIDLAALVAHQPANEFLSVVSERLRQQMGDKSVPCPFQQR